MGSDKRVEWFAYGAVGFPVLPFGFSCICCVAILWLSWGPRGLLLGRSLFPPSQASGLLQRRQSLLSIALKKKKKNLDYLYYIWAYIIYRGDHPLKTLEKSTRRDRIERYHGLNIFTFLLNSF